MHEFLNRFRTGRGGEFNRKVLLEWAIILVLALVAVIILAAFIKGNFVGIVIGGLAVFLEEQRRHRRERDRDASRAPRVPRLVPAQPRRVHRPGPDDHVYPVAGPEQILPLVPRRAPSHHPALTGRASLSGRPPVGARCVSQVKFRPLIDKRPYLML